MNPQKPDEAGRRNTRADTHADTQVDASQTPERIFIPPLQSEEDDLIAPARDVKKRVSAVLKSTEKIAKVTEDWLKKNVTQTSDSFIDIISRARTANGGTLTAKSLGTYIIDAFGLRKRDISEEQIHQLQTIQNKDELQDAGDEWILPNAYLLTKKGKVVFLHIDERKGIVIVPVEKML